VNNDTALNGNEPGEVRTMGPDRIVQLSSSVSHLRTSNRVLLDQLRGTMHELREIRSSLRGQSVPRPTSSNGKTEQEGPVADRYGLTRREAEVAKLLAEGWSNQAIARELQISQHTSRHHTQRILAKLEVHSRGEAGAKLRSTRPHR